MQQLFLSPGSKYRLARSLIALYPPHHTYIEPYAGGAACFWRKTASPVEVLNDFDPQVVQAYQVVQNATNDELTRLAEMNWTVSPETFAACQPPDPDPIINAYRFIYRRRASRACHESVLLRNRVGLVLPVARHLGEQRQRLKGVRLTQGDAEEVIIENDRAGVFMFVDPPWPGYYKKWQHFSMDTMTRLIELLSNIKHARFMWAESPMILPMVEHRLPSWRTQEMVRISSGWDNVQRERREVVFTNYD